MSEAPVRPEIVDPEGRTWRLIIPVGVYVQLRDENGIDLMDEKSISDVMIDPVKRSEVLLAILDRQAAKLGLNQADVDELLCDPETAPPAHVALEAALQNFYRMQGAAPLVEVIRKVREAQKTLMSTATERINSSKMDQMLEREIQKAGTMIDKSIADMEAKLNAGDGSNDSSALAEQPTGKS